MSESTNQGLTYCRSSMKGKGRLGRTSDKWCSCGFKEHGKNHENGIHHKKHRGA